MSNNVEERYLVWLCDIIADGGRIYRVRRSKTMLRSLFYKSFPPFVPNDDNRASEGQGLRDKFIDVTGIQLGRLYAPLYFRDCSVLEMLIALSERMAFQIFNPMEQAEPDIASCFWEIVENLNLKPNQSNDKIIHKLSSREYNEDGWGGMFPLNHPREDQRAVEIWYQMMAYINENY